MRLAINKWISGLAIASLALHSVAQATPDSDVQRALKASKIGDYGFDEVGISCRWFSNTLLREVSKTYKVGDDTYMYVATEDLPAFVANRKKYINSRFSSNNELRKIMYSPLTLKIKSFFMNKIDDIHAAKEQDTACRNNAKVFLTNSFPQAPIPTSSKAISKTNSKEDHHAQCLEARDYEGCMRVKSSGGTAAPIGDKCSASGSCWVTTKGTDSFGLPKPMGWFYYYSDDGNRIFYLSKYYRVPHKGQPTRYLGIKRITRYYQSPKAGTSGSVIGGGPASTNCTGYGSSINCTTTGGGSRYIPGQSATPGGVRNIRFDSVYDCKDNTYANYEGARIMYGGWAKNSKSPWAKSLKEECDKGPAHIMKLDTMKVQM